MNSYEEFLQSIDELYDQNKIDFNNYKLLKKEIESIENEHEKQKSEYRNYFKMLESKIKNLVVSGGGITENQVRRWIIRWVLTVVRHWVESYYVVWSFYKSNFESWTELLWIKQPVTDDINTIY